MKGEGINNLLFSCFVVVRDYDVINNINNQKNN